MSDSPHSYLFKASRAQQRLWFVDKLHGASSQYNIPHIIKLTAELNYNAFEQALDELVARHESLRTSFRYQDQQLFQVIAEAYEVPVQVEYCKCLTTDIQQEFIERACSVEFDLTVLPLLKVNLLSSESEEHVIAFVFHHIISDGWSLDIFLSELAALYQSRATATNMTLPTLELQYADFSQWHNQQYEAQDSEAEDAINARYTALKDIPDLALITDKPRSGGNLHDGALESISLNSQLVERVETIAGQLNVTPFSLFMATWQLLLARTARQQEFAVGFPAACRNMPELEGIIGLFMNTAVLPANVDESLTVEQFIDEVHQTVLSALEYQDVPVDMLIDKLRPVRNLSMHPVFQVMLSYHRISDEATRWNDAACERLSPAINVSKYELTLTIEHGQSDASVIIEYATELFEQSTIRTLLASFSYALEGMLDNLTLPLQKIALCNHSDSAFIAAKLTSSTDNFDGHLLDIFERNADLYSEDTALVFNDASISYRELNQVVAALSAQLYKATDTQGSIIAVCMQPGLELVASLLAIMKTGAAYLVLDPQQPIERLAYFIDDAGVQQVLCQEDTRSLISELNNQRSLRTMVVDRASLVAPDTPVESACALDSRAYIIYTSGSTGQPKGVQIPQRNVMRLFSATSDWFSFSQNDTWTLFHSTAFDFSVWEMWGALLHGGKLVIVDKSTARDPNAFYQLVLDHDVSVLSQTPSAFMQFVQVDEKRQATLPLKKVIFGGEALDFSKLVNWYTRHHSNDIQLVNMYGITETTVHVTYLPITETLVDNASASLIGEPIPDLGIALLDAQGNPVPKGMVGEMFVSGAGLATGYLNRAELTRERFVELANPISGELQRHYRTGDLARLGDNGTLEYLGRCDAQVKIRGYRIETGEVENVISSITDLSDVVVLARALSSSEQKQLVAYLVGGDKICTVTLRESMLKRLPDYMVPAAFVSIDTLPLTINGKLDTRALPEPDGIRPSLNKPYAAPTSKQEKMLCKVWSSVLGVSPIGINDNFFALGGDSLRAVQATEQAKLHDITHSLAALFEHQTVTSLANNAIAKTNEFDYVETAPFSQITESDRGALPTGVVDAYPLSAMQASMFYHMALSEQGNVYHCAGTTRFTIDHDFDSNAFYNAVQNTVAAHDVYKTSFDFESFSEPMQLVHDSAILPTVIEDISHLSEAEQNAFIIALLDREKLTPFDLSKPTLLRYFIHLRSPRVFQFTMTECHPVFDGWSYHSMIVEVFNRYACLTGNKPYVEKDQGKYRYRDFVALEKRVEQDPEHQAFWKAQLDDLTVTRIPRLKQEERDKNHQDIRVKRVLLEGEMYKKVREFCRLSEVPMKSLALAAHLKVLSIVSGETDVITGIPANGRPETSAGDRLAGLFLNTLPFRMTLSESTWQELAKSVFQLETKMLSYRRYPFANIQRDIGGEQILDEVLFNYLDFHVYDELENELGLRAGDPLNKDKVNEGTNFALTVHFQHLTLTSNLKRNQLSIDIDYDTAKLTSEQAEQLQSLYYAVLKAMVTAPQVHHDQVDFASDLGLASVVKAISPKAFEYEPSLGEQFDTIAKANEHKTALICENVHLPYGMLLERVNRLADHLSQQGLKRCDKVGVLLPRSIEYIETVLAITRLGACYVPLDTDDPLSRKYKLLQQADAALLITQSSTFAESGLAEELRCRLTLIDQIDEQKTAHQHTRCDSANDSAYIIFTSGSTGEPKGVEVLQRNIMSLITDQNFADFQSDSVVLQTSPTTFDASTFEIWATLLNGATLVINPNRILTNSILESTVTRYSVNTLYLSASLFNTMIDEDPLSFNGIRRLLVGGESLSAKHVSACYKDNPQIKIVNGYGPTETTTFAIMEQINANELGEQNVNASVPIGRPIAHVSAWILDEFKQLVPIGTPGELYIGGGGVSKGYYGNETMTNKSFVTLPLLSSKPVYKTGDRVRMRPDGKFEFLERLDLQVKVRGFRIDLAEIAATLKAQDGVINAYVLVRGEGADKRVVAYWTADSSTLPLDFNPREALRRVLPVYMLPNYFCQLDELPVNRNGKVDKRKLLDIRVSQGPDASDSPTTQPSSENERAVLAIWQQLLDNQNLSIDSHFFEVGGHSLLLSKMLRQLKQAGYDTLTLVDLLRYPTVRTLARFISQGSAANQSNIAMQTNKRNKLHDLRQKKRDRKPIDRVGA